MSHSSISKLTDPAILIADADTESLLSMATVLIARNYQVFTASTFNRALEIAETETLDLLITDTRLGQASGQDLISEIHLNPEQADLPVMFVTFNQTADIIRRSHDSQSAFHLKKPIDAKVLCGLVEKALWMPHLISSHIEQKTVKQPHISFAKNPVGNPFESHGVGMSIFPGTPITN